MSAFRKITELFYVSPQLPSEAIDLARKEGFTHIICNRPDGEETGQPTIEEMKAVAEASGLGFTAIPVGAAGISSDDIARTLALMATGQKILGYCRSGTRSAIVHALSRRMAGDPVATILMDAAEAGYDLTPYKERLESLSQAASE